MVGQRTAEIGGTAGTDPFVQLAFVHAALDDYSASDLEQLDTEWLAELIGAIERVKVRVDAAAMTVAAEAERRRAGHEHGFFSTRTFLKHHGRLSGPEARARMQLMRMFTLLPDWKTAAETGNGRLGDDHLRLMARVAANPRIHDALVEASDELLCDAETLAFDEFERRLRDFERSVDHHGARRTAERAHDARDVRMRQQPDGSWRLSGRFGSLQGAEVNHALAYFNDAQFRTDWATAELLAEGGDIAFTDLDRCEPQRRADALHEALLRGASSPADAAGPLPCLNVLIDETTLHAVLVGQPLDPARYRNVVCRTQSGDPIDVTEAATMAFWAHIRRVVHNGAGVVIDLGRRSRLFRGGSRDAAMLLTDRCLWPGCDRDIRRCQTDHNVGWMHEGTTGPDNGGAMCGPHNRLKHRAGFTVRRLDTGDWIILDHDNEIVG